MYMLVYSEDAVRQLLQMRPVSNRESVIKILARLAGSPYQRGRFTVVDSTGRQNEVIVGSGFAITFWADHAVSEVRIMDISRLPKP